MGKVQWGGGKKKREEGKRGVSEQKNHEMRPTKWKQMNSQQSVPKPFRVRLAKPPPALATFFRTLPSPPPLLLLTQAEGGHEVRLD